MRRLLFAFLFLSVACENVLVNEKLGTDQQTVFEIMWEDFDRNYAGFTVRTMDWDSVYSSTSSAINSGLDQKEFQNTIEQILLSFKDIHVGFVIPNRDRVIYEAKNPNSLDGIGPLDGYIENWSESAAFRWGSVANENIGYIHIKSFNEGIGLSEFSRIDQVLSLFAETNGLIIDVRGNPGGSPASSNLVASRFIDHSFVAIKTQFRNGPNHDDFDAPINGVIEPDGPFQYLKPISILMNKSSQSATELFILPLELQKHVTTVGDYTAGGLGLNSYRELPNGWNYRLTTTLTSNANNLTFEGSGIPPHEFVFITESDSVNGVDPQLEQAIELLAR